MRGAGMAAARKDIPGDKLIEEINESYNDLYQKFSIAFSEGKEKPEGQAGYHLLIFQTLWEQLNSHEPFLNIEDVHQHYSQVNERLDQIINQCTESNTLMFLQPNIREMLKNIIELHHSLAKYQFILGQLKIGEDLFSFQKNISAFKKMLSNQERPLASKQREMADWERTHFPRIEGELKELDLFFQTIRYKKKTEDLKSTEEDDYHFLSKKKDVFALLLRLPTSDLLNMLLENINELNKAKIQTYINLIQTILTKLDEDFLKFFDDISLGLEYFSNQLAAIQKNIETWKKAEIGAPCLQMLKITGYRTPEATIMSCQDELSVWMTELNKNCSSQTSWQNLFIKSSWAFLSEPLKISDKIMEFAKEYSAQYPNLMKIKISCAKIDKEIKEIMTVQSELAAKIVKLRHRWQGIHDVVNEVKLNLENFLEQDESQKNFFKFFIKHHFKKILIGSGVGCATSTLLALTAGLSSSHIGLLIASGTLCGGSVGAGIGFAKDHCNSHQANNALPESMPLLENGSFQNDYDSEDEVGEQLTTEKVSTYQAIPLEVIVKAENAPVNSTPAASSSWHLPSLSRFTMSLWNRFASSQEEPIVNKSVYQLK